MRTADQQLHNILTQLRNRFKDHERLMFLALLDPKKFASYRKNFPSSEFQSLTETCRLHCDLPRLKTELTVMNNVANFEARSPSDLLHFLTLKELTESMLQLHHLTCLVLTIPMSTLFLGSEAHQDPRQKQSWTGSPGSFGTDVHGRRTSFFTTLPSPTSRRKTDEWISSAWKVGLCYKPP